jgi:CRISPR-associated protein Csb1
MRNTATLDGLDRGGTTMSTWSDVAADLLAVDGPAALVCRQWLTPAEGPDAVIFPPTFAATDGGAGKAGYNIDPIGHKDDNNAPRMAILDTVGSQANRMEPLFKKANGVALSSLVPQIEIKAGDKTVDLLDAGHRAGDAIARYSQLGTELRDAFATYQATGDARRLAKIAPTSLVFGAWDSRDTQAKLPRLVASTIRGYDVVELQRSAQYNPPVDYVGLGLLDDAADKKVLDTASELGFRHAPAAGTHGGVIVRGDIRRDAILSLVALRTIGPKGEDGAALRQYVLGLALVAMTHDRPHDLRQGCLLVGNPDKPAVWELVSHDGTRRTVVPDAASALEFAQTAATAFGVGTSRSVDFDPKAANAAIKDKVAGKGKSKKG